MTVAEELMALGMPSGQAELIDANTSAGVSVVLSYFNVLTYGAIGNGSSNPASGHYRSLGALQAAYSFATALTNEMDWLGTQAAINAATSAGGIVFSPNGTFICTNSSSAADGSGTLTFPNVSAIPGQKPVSWLGANGGTYYKWPNDLGSGKFAVTCGNRTSGSSAGFFQDVHLTGPGVGSTLNASSINMQGIGSNDRRSMFRMNVSGFYVGVNIVGGQALIQEVYSTDCYYGWYWDTPQSGNFGDIVFEHCYGERCMKASIGINASANIPTCLFTKCFLGTSPFSIFKETTGSQSAGMVECTFVQCQFENIGNALFGDGLATPLAELIGVVFDRCQFLWNTGSFNIAALSQTAIINSSYTANVKIIDPVLATTWIPGTTSLLDIGSVTNTNGTSGNGITLIGDMDQMLQNCITASLPFFSSRSGIAVDGAKIIAPGWEGTVAGHTYIGYGGAANDLVVWNGTGLPAGNTSDTVIGVLTQLVNNPIIVNKGTYLVNSGANTIASGVYVRVAANGLVIAATGANDTTSVVVGWAVAANSGSQTLVKLQGMA